MRVNVATQNKMDASKPHSNQRSNPEVKSIDWKNSSDRKWLMTHLHWAMHNEMEVRLVPMPKSN